MRYKTTFSVPVHLVDRDNNNVPQQFAKKLDGLACHSDHVLNYTTLPFKDDYELRGGYPRLIADEKNQLSIVMEIDSQQKLNRKELKELREDFEGQATDGIGAGCFDELAAETGVSVEVKFPLKSKLKQIEGTAWRPKSTTQRGNERRIAAAGKLVDKLDEVPNPPRAGQKKPNFKKLFRLLDKVDRIQFFDQIKAELEARGNDLSSVGDRELPYMNQDSPKLLRLLLGAGLPSDTIDVEGNSLLTQAVANPKSLEQVLKLGVDVNRINDCFLEATALHRAARLGVLKSVELLLEHGATRRIKNRGGKTALEIADKRSPKYKAITKLLE